VGEGVACTVPIYEGYALPHAIGRSDVAGQEVTDSLKALLTTSQLLDDSHDRELVRDIKERVAYVALDFAEEMKKTVQKTFNLPDGKTITLGSESFRAAEALFEPSLLGKAGVGLHTLIAESIQKCDADIRRDLYGNIIVAGGTSMLPGLPERLQRDIQVDFTATSPRVLAEAPAERRYSTWIGGSILASMSTYKGMWITKLEYEECGPQIVHRKCF